VLICGRYEGIDERILQILGAQEVSIGDFVLSGGETAALALLEAVVRLVPGAMGNEESLESESFEDGLLDHPHYTRPRTYRGIGVPDVLVSGDHARVAVWRQHAAREKTRKNRPDLLDESRPED
jgi:tRNA (guanine37-N1)-methyltransferase